MILKLGMGLGLLILVLIAFRDEATQEIRDDSNKIVIEQLENKRLILAKRYAKSGAEYLKVELDNIDKKLEEFNSKDKEQEERLAQAIANSEKAKKELEQKLREEEK